MHKCGLHLGTVRTIIVIALIVAVSDTTAMAVPDPDRHPITIKDLIELSYIVNPTVSTYPQLREAPPGGIPLFSPDQRWFLLISQRGKLSNGKLESTLWLFSRDAVYDYLSGRSARPSPKELAVLRAESNTPVISEVRWLPDSNTISFLGKEAPAEQRLYMVNLKAVSVTPITPRGSYVTQYAIANDTIAYTSLMDTDVPEGREQDLVDVTGKSIYALLFPRHKKLEDEDEGSFYIRPNALHVIENGREIPLSFTFEGKPLRLFIPTLSLSPDGKRLITVAPVHEIPAAWADYRPAFDHDYLYLRPENKYALAEDNPWKAAQYVVVDLKTGSVRAAIAAPAGRVLGYAATTTAFWLPDPNHAVLTDSFLPLDGELDAAERTERAQSPALVTVNLADSTYERIADVRQGGLRSQKLYHVDDISWDKTRNEITVTYQGSTEDRGVPEPERYGYHSGRWIILSSKGTHTEPAEKLNLAISEDLSHPPALTGTLSGAAAGKTIWDPNPQLADMRTGAVSLYHWKDSKGNTRSGILALPPDYERGRRYPLVIQTHGYNPKRYFADGEYTTGSGGRALNALGVIVLQMDMPMFNFMSPEDGPFATDGFEAAISQLSQEGLIDRQRVGVIGFSYTCFHVLYAMTHRPDLLAAASITDGNNMSYVQWVMSTDERNALQEISEKTNGGPPFSDHLMSWSRSAPNFALDKARTPLLISSLETGELLGQWETYSGLRKLGKPVDMIWLRKENAPHILVKPRERYISQQSAVDWFDFWLNDHEDPDPGKAEQYARWRELRKLATAAGNSPSAQQ
jgi:dipeptidyl aminopeptidase/acylaminoacyl peptidase